MDQPSISAICPEAEQATHDTWPMRTNPVSGWQSGTVSDLAIRDGSALIGLQTHTTLCAPLSPP